jgi:hypothetical protein|tara:strand:+ start:90 stop:269 length:180 start_codon:yes stop_codon:yes gene_type:complete
MPEKYEVTVKIVVPSKEDAIEFVDSLAEYTGLFPSDSDPLIEVERLITNENYNYNASSV